ncbi:hypothetical protein GCM10011512_30000 [Tersicoccus solisilvae]|uniref:Flagellar motor switch protein FliN-like C-terminal domain-containing protein n=1 Tax=Tersicoccus solisilvae TaxID=1882339 RepID=A0ABQ1PQH0_9MICC|nr:flagellar motor switch protein FliN [Tersicoccus solisilvae]GGD01093.1 hypothetical protein GCM10011512_30000 [Tersicoccus solisilvae]
MTVTTTGAQAADLLAAYLPHPGLAVSGHADAAAALAFAPHAVTAAYIGADAVDLALLLRDTAFLAAAAGAGAGDLVQATDVLRPALEHAVEPFAPGALSDLTEADATDLLLDPRTEIHELSDGVAVFGWFALRIRAAAAGTTGPTGVLDASFADRLGRINDVEMNLTVEIGRARMRIIDALALEPGHVIELDRSAGAPADIMLNGRRIALGEVVVVDQDYGVRITRILDVAEAPN